jgi:hypothetical protein
LWKESLLVCWEIGEKRSLIYCLMGLASVDEAQGCPDRAAQLLAAAAALSDATGFRMRPVDVAEFERSAAKVRRVLSDAQYEAAWRRGHAMSIEQAISLALDEADPKQDQDGQAGDL